MKVIVGLGNPGREYENTRHNVGFMAVDRLAERHARAETPRGRFQAVTVEASLPGGRALLMKPTTYMNLSGAAVTEAVRFYKLDPAEDLFVIADDFALPVGALRIRKQGSSGGQKGLADIERRLSSDLYTRCRIGIGDPGIIDASNYVLGKFTPEQREEINPVITAAADAAELWLAEGADAAMNRFNTRAGKGESAPRQKNDNGAAESDA
ncbi:MAG: aminoacyl-tRNA hydrolase [Planctomycetota bacterium]|nr:aminoacyl-tRNA hydrolase [Planctomycetota bacterium]